MNSSTYSTHHHQNIPLLILPQTLQISLLGSILAFLTVRHALLGPRPDPRDSLPGWRSASPRTHLSLIVKLARIDWIGAFFFTTGAILVLIGLSWGSTEAWNKAKVIATLTVGAVLIVVFIAWEIYLGQYEVRFVPGSDGSTPTPTGSNVVIDPQTGESRPLRTPPRIISHTNRMLPMWIFRNYQIPVVFFAAFTGGMVMFGCLYFLAIYWSIVAGFENTKTGKLEKHLAWFMVSLRTRELVTDAHVLLGTQLVYLTPGLGGGVWIASAMIKWWRQACTTLRS